MLNSYQIELRHLHYFKAVAEELHFRRAAERLHITQPGLSRQIQHLEKVMETQLFTRSKRKVALTTAGVYFYQEVVLYLNQLESTIKFARLIDQGKQGEIRIGFVGSAMQNVIPDLLWHMREQFPQLQSSLEELSISEQIHALEKDRLDVGFVRLNHKPKGFHMGPVFIDHFSLVLPEKHPLTKENFNSLRQVSDEPFILFDPKYSADYYQKIMSIFEDHDFLPKVAHRSVHANTIFRLVEKGMGLAIVPNNLQFGFNLGIKCIPLTGISQQAILSIIWKEGNRNPALKNFLSLLDI